MDLIDRQAAIDAICNDWCGTSNENCRNPFNPENDEYYYCDGCGDIELIKALPSAQPLRHGRWETVEGWDGDEYYRCSECSTEFVLVDGTPKDNDYCFCPHCGADMRGEQNG